MSEDIRQTEIERVVDRLYTIGTELHRAESGMKSMQLALLQVEQMGLDHTVEIIRADIAQKLGRVRFCKRMRTKYEAVLAELAGSIMENDQ